MPKMSTEPVRHALNGETMGTRWSALFFTPAAFDAAPLQAALQKAVSEVDGQMSTWKPDSDLMRINRAGTGTWIAAPEQLLRVLRLGLAVGRASGGAFDVAMGDAVSAWGFGPDGAAGEGIRIALSRRRRPAWEVIELGEGRLRKSEPVSIDLNGIAKGHGVDRLAETLQVFGIESFLVGIDGEMRAAGLRPDGSAWTIGVEQPDPELRAVHSVLALENAAVATSGDYRHWVEVAGRRLSHTMDPRCGAPLMTGTASVTTIARTCAEADAWATALMVLGHVKGTVVAREQGLEALFLTRDKAGGITPHGVGRLFTGRHGSDVSN